MAVRASIALLVLATLACSKPGDESKGRRSPIPLPEREVTIPPELNIPVEVDGVVGDPVTAAKLSALKPDFADEERSAWLISRVLPGATGERVTVQAVGSGGVAILLTPPGDPEMPQPVLFLTRRGDVVAAVIDPSDPFPTYHGQGGRLRRPGDPLPRLSGVEKLRVTTGAGLPTQPSSDAEAAGALAAVEWVVDGGEPQKMSPAELGRIPELSVAGDQPRHSWSLRDAAHVVAGDTARVISVEGGGDQVVAIEKSAWDDDARTPILRANPKGLLKFHWIENGKASSDSQLRGVHRVVIKR